MVKKYIIAIDLGGTNLKCALLDSSLSIKAKTSFSTKSFDNKHKLIDGVADSVNSFILSRPNNGRSSIPLRFSPGGSILSRGLTRGVILGVGIGLPGPVDTFKGIVHFLPNIPGWKSVEFKKILERKTNLPVFIDNDAKLMALAEHKIGSARGYANALCLTLGTGVGAGLIINGALYRGKDNAAGELGHLPLNENGPLCGCGGKACLETYIGNAAIIREAHKLFSPGISLEELSRMARNNNARAVKLWSRVGERLGLALSGIVNLLNLDAIVIGGGVSKAGGVLFASVKQTILRRAMSVQAKRVKIFKAKLANDAGIIGAGFLVKEMLAKGNNVKKIY